MAECRTVHATVLLPPQGLMLWRKPLATAVALVLAQSLLIMARPVQMPQLRFLRLLSRILSEANFIPQKIPAISSARTPNALRPSSEFVK